MDSQGLNHRVNLERGDYLDNKNQTKTKTKTPKTKTKKTNPTPTKQHPAPPQRTQKPSSGWTPIASTVCGPQIHHLALALLFALAASATNIYLGRHSGRQVPNDSVLHAIICYSIQEKTHLSTPFPGHPVTLSPSWKPKGRPGQQSLLFLRWEKRTLTSDVERETQGEEGIACAGERA